MAHLKKTIAIGMIVATVAGLMPGTSMAATYGWVEKDGKWYFYDGGRIMKYKSCYDSDKYCYYLVNGRGERITGKTGLYTTKYKYSYYGDKVKIKTSYYIKSDGTLLTDAWKKISGKYYYFSYNGEMQKGVSAAYEEDAGKKVYYLLGNDGARITKKGWQQVKYKSFDTTSGCVKTFKHWYYVKSDGTLQKGLKKIKGKYYLFNSAGCLMQNNSCETSSGKMYVADKDGVRIKKTGWVCVKRDDSGEYMNTTYSRTESFYYYLNSDSTVLTGWQKIGGKWYYLHPYRCAACTLSIYNKETGKYDNYFFNSKGVCKNYKG